MLPAAATPFTSRLCLESPILFSPKGDCASLCTAAFGMAAANVVMAHASHYQTDVTGCRRYDGTRSGIELTRESSVLPGGECS
jgi:hypothetical protein